MPIINSSNARELPWGDLKFEIVAALLPDKKNQLTT